MAREINMSFNIRETFRQLSHIIFLTLSVWDVVTRWRNFLWLLLNDVGTKLLIFVTLDFFGGITQTLILFYYLEGFEIIIRPLME